MILVTGSTGQLGTPTLAALREAGQEVRGLSRSGRDDSTPVDLFTGEGLDEALTDVDTVVHCAQTQSRRDLQVARNLVSAAGRAGVRHLVLISIVGIEQIPMPYYNQRLEIERIAQASGVPLTIQRATQFHSLVDGIFSGQRFLPVILAPDAQVQPIAVEEVAGRLAELAVGEPRGRMPDIGGPQQLGIRALHARWKRATHSRRGELVFRLPGTAFAALEAGANLVAGEPFGRETFDEYLQKKYA
jgi:Predicted nucleoside-diphosphate-sugar epimerases